MLQTLRAKKYFLSAFLVSLAINQFFILIYKGSTNFILNCNYLGGVILPHRIFLILSLVFLCVVIYFGFKSMDFVESVGFGFLVGGGVWNLIQRAGEGCVYDYFKLGPIYTLTLRFNISDILIWMGLLLLLTRITLVCIKTLLSKKSVDVKR